MGDALNYQRYFLYDQGASERMLPHQMPPCLFPLQKVENFRYMGYRQALHEQIRCDIGKAPSPTVAIIDSQSVKTTELAIAKVVNAI